MPICYEEKFAYVVAQDESYLSFVILNPWNIQEAPNLQIPVSYRSKAHFVGRIALKLT